MNFFEAQDYARRSTSLLILLFLLAIVLLLLLSNFIIFEYLYVRDFGSLTFSWSQLSQVFDANLSILLCCAIIGFITLGSLYKLIQLSSGGPAIAQQLGGVIVPRSSSDPLHKKILNVVEEMAIASGMPVPQVYILNEQGINAFAAGWKTTNAVIGITQGAVERLTRDELQGVIAHEFSHIFNGDMRLNIRLIAILHGILMIGMLGRIMLRSLRFTRNSRGGRGGGQALLVILGIGGVLMVVGYSGTFFGNWIKSLISRQREYLADASAVQFTRSSEGIANALKKIGGAIPGSALMTAAVDEYSHAYFALGDTRHGLFTFSTHPPLKERIYRIQPFWDGKYIFDASKPATQVSDDETVNEQQRQASRRAAATSQATILATTLGAGIGASVSSHQVLRSLNNIGNVSQAQVDAAVDWKQALPEEVIDQAENPYSAQALILAILLHEDPALETAQLSELIEEIGELHTRNVKQVQQLVSGFARVQTLPLIDLALPTLREMTLPQYQRFKNSVQNLILADDQVDLREWMIQRLVLQHLDEHYGLRKKPLASYFVLGSAKYASELVLTMLAYMEHTEDEEARQAFDTAKRSIGAGALQISPVEALSFENLDRAMDELELLKMPIKKRFLQACIGCITYDGQVTVQAYELTRAIASCLGCPMPPADITVFNA
jgi:Zn-dependent protease with chaperone function